MMTTGSTISGLAHIGIMTADMDASVRFYTENLNFTCTHRQFLGTTELAFLKVGDCIVELVAPAANEQINSLKPGQIDHIALRVTNLDAEVERLEKAGIRLFAPAKDAAIFENGIRCVFFPGPSGERIELFQIN